MHPIWKRLRSRTMMLVVFVVLLVPFALFFSGYGTMDRQADAAGTVFGKPVTWQDFDRQQRWIRFWYGWDVPEGLPADLAQALIAEQVWDRLTLIHEAKEQRLTVQDDELRKVIAELPMFQQDGRFDPARYRQILSGLGFTPQVFESLLRENLLVQRLMEQVSAGTIVTDEELRKAYETAHEKVTVKAVVVPTDALAQDAKTALTEEDVRAYYDAHQEGLRTPERRAFRYVARTRAAVEAEVPASELPVTEEPSAQQEAQQAAAQAREQAIRSRLVGFAIDLEDAKKDQTALEPVAQAVEAPVLTAGPVSLQEGLADPSLDPQLLEAAFALPAGQLSEVIETDRGVYLAQITNVEAPQTPPLDAVKPQVEARLVAERAQEAARQRAEAIRARTQEGLAQGRTLEESAQDPAAKILSPGPFTRTESIEGLGLDPDVNAAVFSARPGELTPAQIVAQGAVFFQVVERIPPSESDFAAAKEPLREALAEQARHRYIREWLTQLRQRANVKSNVQAETSAS